MSGLHLPQRIRSLAVEKPDAPALTCGETTVSFGELDRRTNRVATALAARARAGGRVGTLLRMRLEAAETFVGCAKAGLVFTPLNWRLTPGDIGAIAADADLDVLVTQREFAALAAAAHAALPGLRVVFVDPESSSDTEPDSALDWDQLVAAGADTDPGLGADPEAGVLHLFTSGTTGRPKGVVSTHRNLHNDPAGLRIYQWQPDSVALNAMPLFHIAGAGWLSTCLSAGVHAVLLGEFNPAAVAHLIERHHVTHAFLVPATIQLLLDLPGLDAHDLSSLRLIAYGSSPIAPHLLRRAMDTLGCGFVQRYGMTETTGSVTALAAADHEPEGERAHLLRSVGQAMPGVELEIRDIVTGERLPAGHTGEIVCRSRNNVSGYWRRPAESAALLTGDGFLRTGDAGHLDESGYLFVTDRLKDLIITGGENVYPIEVESVLAQHPAVAEVAVIGVPDHRWGEAVTAVVRLADSAAVPDESELVAFATARLASYKRPQRVHIVDELPRNASGKILKRDLRDLLGQDGAA
ncbi:long-chain-fatty-acid--CoA ligase [Tomitella biformata]|uniref:long-chain-fatty-acid--CoA ligase n=1 Tax=Tomitella biformata TaxID=630403 RepID=UPI0004669919|nr:long-chain-fatty-acid--CoA ligase [Tomitella biformata]